MAIIDGNTRKISGTDIEISNLFITCIQPQIHVTGPQMVKITITYQCYTSPQKWIESEINNTLKIEGLVKRNFEINYDRVNDGDIFEFIDKGTKDDLLVAFPDSDPDLITFIPPHTIE